MRSIIRITLVGIVGTWSIVGASLAGCSATNTDAISGGDGGTGGDGGQRGGGDGAVGEGGALGEGGGDGGAVGDGGVVARNIGRIVLDQSDDRGSYSYDTNVSFTRTTPTGTPTPCPEMLSVTMGACTATKLCVPPAVDAGTRPFPDSLNAGTITIAGGTGAAGAAVLTYGPQTIGPYTFNGYPHATGSLQFFAGGDMLTATGGGGADLPAIPTQTVVAPSDITVTAPACTVAGCPPVDRTVDLVASWTGGAAGKAFFTYESLSDKYVVVINCEFDASAGTGTVPAALLAHLEKAGDPGIAGVVVIGVTNQTPIFMVGDIPTTFTVLGGGGLSGTLIVSR